MAVASCEKADSKRKFAQKVLHELHENAVCCQFQDIEHLGGRNSQCAIHGGMCPIMPGDRPHIAFMGTSCKELSVANNGGDPSCLRDGDGTSSRTFKGAMRFIRKHGILACCIENAKELAHDNDNSQFLEEQMTELNRVVAITLASKVKGEAAARRCH